MIIAATAVSMDAARTYTEVEQHTTGINPAARVPASSMVHNFGARLSNLISTATATTVQSESVISNPAVIGHGRQDLSEGLLTDNATVLSQLTEQVVGQPVTLGDFIQEQRPAPPVGRSTANGLGFQVRRAELFNHSLYTRQEQIMISASGSVQTADGRNISFSLGLEMERQSVSIHSTSLGMAPIFIDPIVLNFEGNQPFMSDSSFLFDLDGDGVEDEIGCPGSGCGFLAFDRNEDGAINNGLELFGPASGSGFGELAGLDSDGNQWLDENDPVFDRLQVWFKGDSGEERLLSMAEAGVGAISIVNVGSDFTLESRSGTVVGQVRASGIFLTEEGEVRSLQEIDLATPARRSYAFSDQVDSEIDATDQAIAAMRAIIDMQRFQLRMMLVRSRMVQRLENTQTHLEGILEQRAAYLNAFFPPLAEEPPSVIESQPDGEAILSLQPNPVEERQLAMEEQPEREQGTSLEEQVEGAAARSS